MKITRAMMEEYSLTSASGTKRQGVIYRLFAGDDLVGTGEASPLPGYSREQFIEARQALKNLDVKIVPPLDISPDGLKALARCTSRLLPKTPSTAMAVETAWLDLAGRAEGISLSKIFSGDEKVSQRIAVNGLIGRNKSDRDSSSRQISHLLEMGINIIKLKVGPPFSLKGNVKLLTRIRKEFGDRVSIRLDANGGWTLKEAAKNLKALAKFSPEYCEQPVATGQLPLLEQNPFPIAADESLKNPDDLSLLLGMAPDDIAKYLSYASSHIPKVDKAPGKIKIFVIKPMAIGGLLRSRRLAKLAAASGIDVVITHLMDGPIAHAAYCELASSLNPSPLACGLSEHELLGAWGQLPPHLEGSTVGSANRPGLGFQLGVIPG